MIRRPPRSTLFPYNDALPIYRGGIPGFDVAGGSDVFRGVSAQAAGRIYGGFGSIGERAGEAQRGSGGGGFGRGAGGRRVGAGVVSGAVDVTRCRFWWGHVVCG